MATAPLEGVRSGLLANALVGTSGVPHAVVTLLPGLLLWFLLGYALYAFVSAAAGAMVARQEEVQSATARITGAPTAALALVLGVVHAPGSWWVTAGSPSRRSVDPERRGAGGCRCRPARVASRPVAAADHGPLTKE